MNKLLLVGAAGMVLLGQGCAVTPPKPVTDTVQNVQNAVQTAQDVKNKVDQGTAQVTATVSSVRNTLDRFSGE